MNLLTHCAMCGGRFDRVGVIVADAIGTPVACPCTPEYSRQMRFFRRGEIPPGAPEAEPTGGAQRLGKITSNVSVPTHAEGGDSG